MILRTTQAKILKQKRKQTNESLLSWYTHKILNSHNEDVKKKGLCKYF